MQAIEWVKGLYFFEEPLEENIQNVAETSFDLLDQGIPYKIEAITLVAVTSIALFFSWRLARSLRQRSVSQSLPPILPPHMMPAAVTGGETVRARFKNALNSRNLVVATSLIPSLIHDRGRDLATLIKSYNKNLKSGYQKDELVKELQAAINGTVCLTEQHEDGETVLHMATSCGLYDVIRQLLCDPRMEINVRNKKGETALHIAARRGFINIINLLKKKGADLNAIDKQKHTPYDYACVDLLTDVRNILNPGNKNGSS